MKGKVWVWLGCVFLFPFLIPVLYGQVGEAWVRLYNGPYGIDEASVLAVDAAGNVYVSGTSEIGASNRVYATIKYKPNGDTAWVRRAGNTNFNATSLAVDGSGNVYVAGSPYIIKYKPNGDTAWVRRYYDSNAQSGDFYALALDTSGNAYVTGSIWNTSFNSPDYVTVKYSANGDTIWGRSYNGPENDWDIATDLAVDNSGNVYVTGRVFSFVSSYDYVTIKYAPNGDTVWVRSYTGLGNDQDLPTALAVDDSGNVYVSGIRGSFPNDDFVTIKYKPNGDAAWIRDYNGPISGSDGSHDLAVDDSGNVYVTGYSRGSMGNFDYLTIKYAPNGDTLWVRRYDPPWFDTQVPYALAVDDSGNVYVTGRCDSIGTQGYATIQYTSNGNTAWVKRYSSLYSLGIALDLAIDTGGNVYVTGYFSQNGSINQFDYATIKYSACTAKPGDVNSSGGTPNLQDVIYLTNFVFDKSRVTPPCNGTDPVNCWPFDPLCRGDVNGSGGTPNLQDVIYLVNFVFDKSRTNPPCNGTDPGNCWTPVVSGVCCLPVQ